MDEASAGDSSLAHQCLALCQTLASQGRTFSLSLTAGSTFNFSMESNGIAIPAQVVKKKSSPSTQRRNAKRREIFLKRKLEPPIEVKVPSECPPCSSTAVIPPLISSVIRVEERPFQCDLCAATFVSKHGLKYHIETVHTIVPPCSLIQTPALSAFPCGQCTDSFTSGPKLKHHIEHHHTPSNVPNSSRITFQHLIPDNWGS